MWRRAHKSTRDNRCLALLCATASACLGVSAPADADTDPAPALAAIEACRNAPDIDGLVASLTMAGFRPISESDADAIFELSDAVTLFMIAAGEAGNGTDAAEAAAARDFFEREYDLRERKVGLAVRSAEQAPQFFGPEYRMYVTVMGNSLYPALPPRHICELTLPESPDFAEMHAALTEGGPFMLPADWIEQRTDPDAALEGGISLSLRFNPDAFEGLFGRPTAARYQFTVNAAPPDQGQVSGQ